MTVTERVILASMKGSILAAVALALSMFVGTAVAARPCERAVIDDWYDNGRFDRTWSCQCLRDAIDLLPDIRPPYSSTSDDLQQQLERQQCEGTRQNDIEGTLTVSAAPGSDKSIRVGDDSFPWGVAIVGGLALGLVALIGIGVHRQRRGRDSS
jgi:uncharacterized membrane protein YedE/YeeE